MRVRMMVRVRIRLRVRMRVRVRIRLRLRLTPRVKVRFGGLAAQRHNYTFPPSETILLVSFRHSLSRWNSKRQMVHDPKYMQQKTLGNYPQYKEVKASKWLRFEKALVTNKSARLYL